MTQFPSPTFQDVTLTGTLDGTFSAAGAIITGGSFFGITLGGTIAGTPTFSGALTFSASGIAASFTGTGAILLPSGTTGQQPDAGNAGEARYNSTTGRYEFGIGGSWVNHVRLTGDTMTGALTIPGITNSGTLAQQGDITLGTGSGTVRLTSGTTGNVTIGLKGSSSLLSFTSGNTGAPTLLQLSSANTIFAKYQLQVQSQGGITPSATGITTIQGMAPVYMNLTWSGTSGIVGDSAILGVYFRANANLDASGSNGLTTGQFETDISGAGASNFKGNTTALGAKFNLTATSGNGLGTAVIYKAVGFNAFASANDGGVGTGSAQVQGNLLSMNTVTQISTGATFWGAATGYELDVGTQEVVRAKYGQTIVLLVQDTADSTTESIALDFNNQFKATTAGFSGGWKTLIGIGKSAGFQPIQTTGGIMLAIANVGGDSMNIGYGFDLSALTVANFWVKYGSVYQIDASGNVTANSYKVGANQVVGARITGWGAATNGAKTAFNGSTATLAQTSAALAQVIADLTTHGLIGT